MLFAASHNTETKMTGMCLATIPRYKGRILLEENPLQNARFRKGESAMLASHSVQLGNVYKHTMPRLVRPTAPIELIVNSDIFLAFRRLFACWHAQVDAVLAGSYL